LSSPLVSVVILSWNSGRHIDTCLEHVFAQTYTSEEVIFVDNYSSDGSLERVQMIWGDRMRIIRNPSNFGFPGGMNAGIAESRGKYILLLNSDMFLERNFLERAVEWFEKPDAKEAGIIGGLVYKVRDGVPTEEIDSTGWHLLPYQSVVNSKNSTEPEWVFGVAGSAPLLSRQALEGCRLPNGDYLDSTYFLYGEDVELYLRLQLMGWKCLFVPVVLGWHMGAGSVGEEAYLRKPDHLQVHAMKNQLSTILTCYPLCLWSRMIPWTLLAQGGLIVYALTRGNVRILRNWLKAVWVTGCMSGYLYKKRRWLQSSRRVSCRYLRSLFARQGTIETLRLLYQKT